MESDVLKNNNNPPKNAQLAEDGLFSLEKLDRASPELWPEKIPGITEFIATSDTPIRTPKSEWTDGLSQEDMNSMTQMSHLSTLRLLREVRDLYDDTYHLGVQEAKEMTRGKYLGIFHNVKKKINPN